MKILIIHQYFLQKNESGGSRWNEMTKLWGELGHDVTVIAGMIHYSTGTKDAKFKGKYVYEEDIDEEDDKKITQFVEIIEANGIIFV